MAQDIQAATTPASVPAILGPVPRVVAQLRLLGPGRILALGVVLLALLALLAFTLQRALEPRYTLLFGGLDAGDVAAVVEKLEAAGIPYRLNARGDAVLVAADRVAETRMMLAEEGLPAGDVVGYELFDRAGGFAATDFQSNVNLKRALEGELARTIASLEGVRAARVHLVQPVRRLFERNSEPPTASVFLALSGAARPAPRQVEGIRYLVASAVPGLDPQRVTVMSDRGELLARGEGEADGFALADAEQYRRGFEERLRDKLVAALERSIGPGRVDAQVTAEMDFDERTTTEEIYDPESQVARSTRTAEETTERSESGTDGTVTVGNNLPGNQAAAQGGTTSREQSNRTDETTNFEISRTVRNARKRAPTVRRLFVAVQVDGTYATDPGGGQRYEPRSAEELAELEAIVRSIAGVDEERGDRVEIVSRPFVQPPEMVAEEAGIVGPLLDRYGHLLEAGMWLAAGALILLFGLRPMLRRLVPAMSAPVLEAREMAVVVGDDGRPRLVHAASGTIVTVDESGQPVVQAPAAAERRGGERAGTTDEAAADGDDDARLAAGEKAEERLAPDLINLKNVEGKVKASLVNDLAEIIDRFPEEALRVIRAWLHE